MKKQKQKKKDDNLVLIDADSMIYIIGSELENMQLEPLGEIKLDEFIKDILIVTGAKYYLGFFGKACGRNFRKDVAVTKPYKGNRNEEKPDWFKFWSPVLTRRMEEYWGFQPCCNIEADDAVVIGAKKFKNQFNKVTISTPDKDLFQCGDTWFYDYMKRTTVYCNEEVAIRHLCKQLIKGDNTDNIPGLPGAGDKIADEFLAEALENKYRTTDMLGEVEKFFIKWFREVMLAKTAKKQEKVYLDNYKITNNIKRFTATIKSDALAEFKVDKSEIKSELDCKLYYKEMLALIKMIDTEEEAKKHEFVLMEPNLDNTVDWTQIDIFTNELEMTPDEEEFEFLNNL